MFKLRNPNVFRNADTLRLAVACVLSLLLHAAVIGAGLMHQRSGTGHQAPEALQATLMPPAAPPVLLAPEPPSPQVEAKPQPAPKPRPPPHSIRPGFTATDAARMALQQMAAHPFYPAEAIKDGLEGEAVVRLFLDESGNAIAARLESSSGHAILDEAAVNAARSVRSLPTGTPGEVLLPVRFRLR